MQRRQSAQGHRVSRAGCCAHVESPHQCAIGMGERTYRASPDLHHGSGWIECGTPHRQRLCNFAVMGSERRVLTFSWNRKYGPGAPGGQDIYVMEIASQPLRWLQLTHEAGSNDFPSWAPDNRHIVFERSIGGHTEIWSMLADGTQQHQLHPQETTSCQTGVGNKSIED